MPFSISWRPECREGGCVKDHRAFALRTVIQTAAVSILLITLTAAQESVSAKASQPENSSLRELNVQVLELRAMIERMRVENAQSRAEMRELRQEIGRA